MTPDFQNNIRLPPKWIELNITKRECATFLAVPGEETLCQCGRRKIDHGDFAKHQVRPETWSPSLHTRSFNTDAYGTILFEGEHHPNKAHVIPIYKYVRLSYDTNPEIIVQLMTYVWNLSMPKLIISLRGGSSNFEMPARLGKIFQAGLIRAARSTNAWVFSNGLNCGTAKHLGTVLNNEKWIGGPGKSKVVSVGITPWGIIENRSDLIGRNKDRVYSPLEHAKSKFLHLNSRHSNFLLVDNGSIGKFGGENYCRRRLEKCVSTYPTTPNRGCDIPIVVVVVEGGFYTLREISDYLYDEPPVPVVIFAGTGRAADLLAWMIRRIANEKEYDSLKEEIYQKMMHYFRIGINSCPMLYQELKNIFLRKNLITIYNPNPTTIDDDFDAVILSSIFRSQHWTPLQQLSLALIWNRVDIANAEVFIYGREWSREHLEHAMMEALVSNRLDFVSLLLEHGLNMQTFLTARRLEALYSLDRMPSMAMRTMLVEFSKTRSSKRRRRLNRHAGHVHHHQPNQDLTLHDVGVAISHMLGHVYKSHYIHMVPKNRLDRRSPEDYEPVDADQTFHHPFDDLFIWAVLTKRHDMSKLLWPHGQGALSKALVAVKLNKYFANEINTAEKILANMAIDFERYAEEWENLSLSLLDSCYRSDSQMARQLLTMELECWSKQTCLTLAVMAGHRMLLGHPCSQMLLADLWMGALNMKSRSTLKIILGILLPPLIFLWEYKSTEELKLLPHQEKVQFDNFQGAGRSGLDENLDFDIFDITSRPRDVRNPVKSADAISLSEPLNHAVSYPHLPNKTNEEKKTDLAVVANCILTNNGEIRCGVPKTRHAPPQTPPQLQSDNISPAEDSSLRSKDEETTDVIIQSDTTSGSHQPVASFSPHVMFVDQLEQTGKNRERERFRFKVQTTTTATPNEYYSNRSSFVTTHHSLSLWSRFVEFQKAPVTNFYRHTIAYFIFIISLVYVILYPQDPNHPGYIECYVVAYFITQFLECIREFMQIEALSLSQKLVAIQNNVWQLGDFIVVTVCVFCGVLLRFIGYYDYGMLIYRITSIYWNVRLYKYMGVHKFVGPKLQMMRRMLKQMVYFAMIIVVVIIAFGIAREAIRFPDNQPSLKELAEAFLEPYVMMFGEVDLDSLSPQCGDDNDENPECPIGSWIVPVAWVVYMLVANILIVNVLIAVFNGIYEEIDSVAVEIWLFQRFNFVMEFEDKPFLPPPFIIICHLISLSKFIYKRFLSCLCEEELLQYEIDEDDRLHIILGNDHSLKSFLNSAEQNMVFDFEEDNLDNLTALLWKEGEGAGGGPHPLGTNTEYDLTFRGGGGLASERFTIQQMKLTLGELHLEMESQKAKMDKLINYFEADAENAVSDAGDEDDEESEDTSTIHEENSTPSSIDTFR